MERIKRKPINSDCIFCSEQYKKNKNMSSIVNIDYVSIPPLGKKFFAVCKNCKSILEYYQQKYPHLWE
jgi:hypothetical protein